MVRTAALAAAALWIPLLLGCSDDGSAGSSAEASAEVSSGGEAPAVLVPEAALDMVPRGMHLLVRVDAEALRSAGVLGSLLDMLRQKAALNAGANAALDYFAEQTDSLLCAARYDAASGGTPHLCVLSGRFGGWSILASPTGPDGSLATDPHGFQVLVAGSSDGHSPSVFVLDDRYILAVDPALFDEVVVAMQDPSARLGAEGDLEAMAASEDFAGHTASVLATIPEGMREALGALALTSFGTIIGRFAQEVTGLTATVDVGEQTTLAAALHAVTPGAASELSRLLRMVIQVLAQSGEESDLDAFLARLDVGVDRSSVTLQWAAPTSELLRHLGSATARVVPPAGATPDAPTSAAGGPKSP